MNPFSLFKVFILVIAVCAIFEVAIAHRDVKALIKDWDAICQVSFGCDIHLS